MSKETSHSGELRVLNNEQVRGFGVFTAPRMLIETPDGSKLLQDGHYRAQQLIDLASYLNELNPEFSDNLRELPAFGKYPMVAATSYDAIRSSLRLRLERFILQGMLSDDIGDVLTAEGERWKQAADITRPHTSPGEHHSDIAMQDIAATFDQFMDKLTSDEGVPGTTITVEMIYKIMTDTVFGGYHDEDEGAEDYDGVATWKEDIVYYLQHLIDVQQPKAVGLLAERLPENVSKRFPKDAPRRLMRFVAKRQGVSEVLENMMRIEDELFPKIKNWIEKQDAKNLTEKQLARMGILGAVLSADKNQRSNDIKRADIFGIYTAALDSTASAANWLMSEFAQNPEILSNVARRKGEDRATYIKYILYELWRKDPITPIIFRQVPAEGTGDRKMPDGTTLPPRTIVLLSVGAAGRDPVRFKNPNVFDPNRYYEMTDEERKKVKRDLELVFAAGDKHRCQGEDAAHQTLTAMINYMADHFDSINIVPTENGEEVIPMSNNSGVCSPVDQYGKVLRYRVVRK